MIVRDVWELINERSPFSSACDWDNVGLLVGDMEWRVNRVLLALDATDAVIDHAIVQQADLIVTHHPLLFSPLKRITAEHFIGRRVIRLIQHHIAYIAMHTNYDIFGMADAAADRLGLTDRQVLEPAELDSLPQGREGQQGIGRVGLIESPIGLGQYASVVRDAFGLSHVRYFGEADKSVQRVAICPGSGKSEIGLALAAGADVLVTGDIDHHSGIDAVAQGLSVIDAGHYGIEHIFMEDEGRYLSERLPDTVVLLTEPFSEPITVA